MATTFTQVTTLAPPRLPVARIAMLTDSLLDMDIVVDDARQALARAVAERDAVARELATANGEVAP